MQRHKIAFGRYERLDLSGIGSSSGRSVLDLARRPHSVHLPHCSLGPWRLQPCFCTRSTAVRAL